MGVRFRILKINRVKVCAALEKFARSPANITDHPVYPVTAYLVDYPHPAHEEKLYKAAQKQSVLDLVRY